MRAAFLTLVQPVVFVQPLSARPTSQTMSLSENHARERRAEDVAHDAIFVVPQKHGMVEAKPGSGGAPQEVVRS